MRLPDALRFYLSADFLGPGVIAIPRYPKLRRGDRVSVDARAQGTVEALEGTTVTVKYDNGRAIRCDRSRVQSVIRADVVGTPNPNQFDVVPDGKPPSAKKRQHVPMDQELEDEQEEVMPDKAKEKRKFDQARIGKSGGLQTW